MKLKKNDVILFDGDSITDCGRDRNDLHSLAGYSNAVAATLAALRPELGVTVFNRGVSGDRTKDLLSRIGGEIKEIKPTVVSILIGINNVWRKFDSNDPTGAAVFQREYRAILDACKKTAGRIVIIEPFIIPSAPDKQIMRAELETSIAAIRSLAAEYKTEFIPADGIFAELSVKNGAELYSFDGVHLTEVGHAVLAAEWLKRIE
ncbi:MAG: SGNH/GDSL hydrolase family protein [Clostridiales bacterium]|jgi:lysophospholipase L1-like esterase|nr:SGNH/GDSL hydrolase family protein [Clostridiales bacterium]